MKMVRNFKNYRLFCLHGLHPNIVYSEFINLVVDSDECVVIFVIITHLNTAFRGIGGGASAKIYDVYALQTFLYVHVCLPSPRKKLISFATTGRWLSRLSRVRFPSVSSQQF